MEGDGFETDSDAAERQRPLVQSSNYAENKQAGPELEAVLGASGASEKLKSHKAECCSPRASLLQSEHL